MVNAPAHFPVVIELPPKDQAIFATAVSARATLLLTGDKKHFGRYFNKPGETLGIIVQTVGEIFVENFGLEPP